MPPLCGGETAKVAKERGEDEDTISGTSKSINAVGSSELVQSCQRVSHRMRIGGILR